MTNAYENAVSTNILNDIYHVEEQLQSYDPHLYLMWNPKMGNMSSWMDY